MTDKSEQMDKPCCCPYCDAEMARAALPWCQVCGVEVFYCPNHDYFNKKDNYWWELEPTWTGYTRMSYWYYTGEPDCFWSGKNWSDRRLEDCMLPQQAIQSDMACYNNNVAAAH